MDRKIEQRVCIKFCVKLGKSATETLEMLCTAFGDEALNRTTVFEWHSRFKAGRQAFDDDKRSGRPSTSKTDENVEKIGQLVRADRRLTIQELADNVGISYGVCQEILTVNLNMRRIAAKFVPRLLTNDQKEQRMNVCFELRAKANEDASFIARVITGDETWIYGYDPETKQQSSQWKSPSSPRAKKARQVRSKTKSMLIVFFDIKGIVHREFVPPNATVNSDFYCDVLRRLREDVRRKRPELWRDGGWLLHHDNAPAHTSLKTTQFLTQNNMVVVPHPPYSPDLAPCDFALFPKLKMKLKGRRFATVSDIQRESQAVLDSFRENDFKSAFEWWKKRWDRCISSQGDYFEGDGSQN